jgi:hypothetical protein
VICRTPRPPEPKRDSKGGGRKLKGIIIRETLPVAICGLPKHGCRNFTAQFTREQSTQTDSPADATLPDVAKFPLRNNAPSAATGVKLVLKDTKPKAFSP